jgi:hypothetical protein
MIGTTRLCAPENDGDYTTVRPRRWTVPVFPAVCLDQYTVSPTCNAVNIVQHGVALQLDRSTDFGTFRTLLYLIPAQPPPPEFQSLQIRRNVNLSRVQVAAGPAVA